MKRLVGSVNPDWRLEELHRYDNIEKALDDVLTSRIDALFNVFDTHFRRLRGLSFIRLPGIGVPLAALEIPPNPISWDTIINPRDQREHVRLVVLKGDVGQMYLRGACGYPNGNITALDRHDYPAIAYDLARIFLQSTNDGGVYQAKKVVFVTAGLTCSAVRETLLGPIDAWAGREPDAAKRRRLAAIARDVQLVREEDRLSPVYRVGLAVRADATKFYELLRDAQQDELFQNAMVLTADEYAKLLIRWPELRPVPLEADLPTYIAREFARACQTALDRLSSSLVGPTTVQEVKEKYGKVWGM